MPGVPAIDEKLAKEARSTNGAAPPEPIPAVDPVATKKAKDRADVAEFARRESARLGRDRARDAEIAQLRTQAAGTQALQQQLAQLQDSLKKLEEDPLEYLERKGVTARHLGERILKRGTPEAQNEELEARIKEANDKAARIEAELKKRDQDAKNAEAMAGAKKAIYDAHDVSKDKTPLLTKKVGRDRDRLVSEYMATWWEVKAKDPSVNLDACTDEEILLATEARLRIKAEEELDDADDDELEKRLTARRARANSKEEPEKVSGATGRQDSETASSRATPLMQATVGGSSGGWKPDNWDKLSDKQQNAILTERLKKRLPFD